MPPPVTAFDPAQLPGQPEIIPPELRQFTIDNTSDWAARVPPQAVGMFVAAVVQWLSHPRFGTKVTAETHNDGWTIQIGLPKPETREDVQFE